MSNHTPGPWTAISSGTAHNEEKHTIRAVDGTWIAETIPHQPKGCSQEANARLISAAPDMLALAQRVANLNENCPEIGAGMLLTLVTEARAAIAKAEGK